MGQRLAVILICLICLAGCKRTVKDVQAPAQQFELTYQVGAFADPANARALKAALEEKGFVAVTQTAVVNQVSFVRVLVKYTGPLEFTYQAGAFTDKANAESLKAGLADKGVKTSIDEAVVDGKTYYRVYAHAQGGIEALLSKLREMGITEPMFRDIKPL